MVDLYQSLNSNSASTTSISTSISTTRASSILSTPRAPKKASLSGPFYPKLSTCFEGTRLTQLVQLVTAGRLFLVTKDELIPKWMSASITVYALVTMDSYSK